MAWLRRAGQGIDPEGASVRWSVAEGSRGRRWRWTVLEGTAIRAAGLLELDSQGRFARLEYETVAGTLTLHPDPDGRSAHGNLVHAEGVDPVALPWEMDRGVRIRGDAFGSALCPGEGSVVEVDARGSVQVADARMTTGPLTVDERGVPVLPGAAEWPLET